MKWWIVVLACWILIFIFLHNISYVAAAPAPFIDDSKYLTLPVVQTESGQLWEARLQCTSDLTSCIVVYAKEICQPGITRFSPSFCWEFGR